VAAKHKLQKGKVSLQTETLKRFGTVATDTKEIPAWLLVIDPGHLRVYAQQEIGSVADMEVFNADARLLATRDERERLVALRLRVIQTGIVSGRHLRIPSDVFDTCGEYLDRGHVWLDQSPDRLDIYTAVHFQKAMAIDPSQLQPEPPERGE
jgi:hypothetical protein